MKKYFFYISLFVFLSCNKNSEIVTRDLIDIQDKTNETVIVSPNSVQIADNEGFFGIYSAASQWSPCKINTSNTRRIKSGTFVRLLTDDEKSQIGDSISFRIELHAAFDEWDRNANSWYIKVPKSTTMLSDINVDNYIKTPLIIYTTPYFLHNTNPNTITYKRDISLFAEDLRDKDYDVYIIYDVDANTQRFYGSTDSKDYCDYPGFRADIFIDTFDKGEIKDKKTKVYVPLISRGIKPTEEITTINFTLKEDIEDVIIWYTSSGHGAGNAEEGITRQHVLSVDSKEIANFSSKVICTPYEYYDFINPWGYKGPNATWRYPTRNWCQGGEIIPRLINAGNLKAGIHTFKIDVNKLNEKGGYTYGTNMPIEPGNSLITNAVLIGNKTK